MCNVNSMAWMLPSCVEKWKNWVEDSPLSKKGAKAAAYVSQALLCPPTLSNRRRRDRTRLGCHTRGQPWFTEDYMTIWYYDSWLLQKTRPHLFELSHMRPTLIYWGIWVPLITILFSSQILQVIVRTICFCISTYANKRRPPMQFAFRICSRHRVAKHLVSLQDHTNQQNLRCVWQRQEFQDADCILHNTIWFCDTANNDCESFLMQEVYPL